MCCTDSSSRAPAYAHSISSTAPSLHLSLHKCASLQMVNKPTTVDEALAYVWALPDTTLKRSEKLQHCCCIGGKDRCCRQKVLLLSRSRGLGGNAETAAQTSRYSSYLKHLAASGIHTSAALKPMKTCRGDVCASVVAYSECC